MLKMSKADLLAEHKKLIKILQHGTRKAQLAEAKSQGIEMKKYLPTK
tara:strand:+ start:6465 stop:6605 length:141 start_codon:yes stop_codon:yes gene_type:complete